MSMNTHNKNHPSDFLRSSYETKMQLRILLGNKKRIKQTELYNEKHKVFCITRKEIAGDPALVIL